MLRHLNLKTCAFNLKKGERKKGGKKVGRKEGRKIPTFAVK